MWWTRYRARKRTVTLTRPSRDEPLQFSILGGFERGFGIFISRVERSTKAEEIGLKRGDQVINVLIYLLTYVFLMKSSKNDFILLPVFYLIMCLMKFWKNKHFESMRAVLLLRCQNMSLKYWFMETKVVFWISYGPQNESKYHLPMYNTDYIWSEKFPLEGQCWWK